MTDLLHALLHGSPGIVLLPLLLLLAAIVVELYDRWKS